MEAKKKPKYPNLAAEMARRGETQKTVANLLGIRNETICHKMAGKVDWTIGEIEKLCEYFDKDYYQLFK